mgnify:CR=1 FL=1
MKKEVIVWLTTPLTKEERRNFEKDHPGERLCFRLKYPRLSLYFMPVLSFIVSVIMFVVLSING